METCYICAELNFIHFNRLFSFKKQFKLHLILTMLTAKTLFINNLSGQISLDWSSFDSDDFSSIITNPKAKLVTNIAEGFHKFVGFSGRNLRKQIDSYFSYNNSLRESVIETHNLSRTVKVKFFPRTGFIDLYEGNTLPSCELNLSQLTKQALSDVCKENENVDFFRLTLQLDNTSVYKYYEQSFIKEETSFVQKVIRDKSIAAAVVLAASLMVGGASLTNNNFESDSSFLLQKKAQIEFSLSRVTDYSAKLNDSLTGFSSTLTEHDLKNYLPSLANIHSENFDTAIIFVKNTHETKKSHHINSAKISHEEKVEMVTKILGDYYQGKDPVVIFKVANAVAKVSDVNKIDPRLFLAIMKVESSFNQGAVSSTGDFSMAQINYANWSKEFKRLKKAPLDKQKLSTDIDYSISKMGEILTIIHNRHKTDSIWYARYHSSTPDLKIGYSKKVQTELAFIEKKEVSDTYEKIGTLIAELKSYKQEKGLEQTQGVDKLVYNLTALRGFIDVGMKKIADNESKTVLAMHD